MKKLTNHKKIIFNEERRIKLPDGFIVSDNFNSEYKNFLYQIKYTFYNLWEIPLGIQQSYKAIIKINISYSGWINIDEVSFQTKFSHPQEYEMQESIHSVIGKIAYEKFALPDFIKSQIPESNRADYIFSFSFEVDSAVVAKALER